MKHFVETPITSWLILEGNLFLIINASENQLEMCNFILRTYFNLLAYNMSEPEPYGIAC